MKKDSNYTGLHQSLSEIHSMVFKTPHNHDRDAESERTGYLETMPTKTQQHQAEEADINTIVRNFNITGMLPQIPLPPSIDEFSDVFDFQTAMNALNAAKASFAMLPADVRASFNNDPHAFVSYTDAAVQAGDLDQLRKWGLAVPEKAAEPLKTEPAGEDTPVSKGGKTAS